MPVRLRLLGHVLLVLLGAASVPGCPVPPGVVVREATPPPHVDMSLGPDDVFEVRVYGEPELTGIYRVSAEGAIDVPLIGRQIVRGQTTAQVADTLTERLKELETEGRLLEAQRLEQRTNFDLEMIAATGSCAGIENYSRFLTGRLPGEPPPTLFEYLPAKAVIVDERTIRFEFAERNRDTLFKIGALPVFAAVGLCNGSALFLSYAALADGPVSVVAPIVTTAPVFTLLISHLFVAGEKADARIAAGVLATVIGIVVLLTH